MKAVRLHAYNQMPVIEDVPEPSIQSPLDVIVKIGGAGVCRTDLHIILGQWAEAMNQSLPYTLGHENAGWVHEVGPAVTNVAVGDTVILHPAPSCGLCLTCRAGRDMHCSNGFFPGLDRNDGGMADYLRTSARACVKLDPETQPKDVAALADAGLTAYHAVRKAIPELYPGTTCAVIGAGGLGHIGIQCLAALTATNIIVVDRNPDALKLAEQLGAHYTVVADGGQVDAVQQLTNGGADVVLDFVAEEGAENDGFAMTRPNGSYFVIGYGGTLEVPTLSIISTERNIIGNIVGTFNDLAELMVLAQTGRVTLHTSTFPLDAAVEALQELDAGRVRGRAILVP